MPNLSDADHIDGLPLPRRLWAMITIWLGITMAVMDGSIANVALPAIAEALKASPAFSIWIVNGYQLAVTISLLPLASLGEIIGYRKVYLCGLVVFTLASLLCALSHDLVLLTAARVVQGFGAAGIMSVNTALVRFTYPHRLLGRGIGFNALAVALSAAAGPTLASAILSVTHWPWLFAVNIPVGIAALAIGYRALPFAPRASHPFDWPSAVLSALAFGLGIATIDSIGHAETPAIYLSELAIACIAAMLLVRRMADTPAPLLPLDLLRIPVFGLSIGTSVASFCAQMLAFTALPFRLHYSFGFSAVEIGLLMTPWPLALAVAAPIAARLVERYPAGLLGGAGLAMFACGLLLMAFLPAHPAPADIVWRMALSGAGFGLFQSPNNRTMIAAAPRERSGGASGLLGTARLVGQTAGTALVALLLARFMLEGARTALLVGAGFAFVAAVLSLSRLSAGAQHPSSIRVVKAQRVPNE